MRKRFPAKTPLICLFGLILVLSGSCVYVGSCDTTAQYQRQVSLSAPLEPGLSFSAETHDGSITVEGAETAECNLLATIDARARTEEEARELAEQIEVRLEPAADGLNVIIDRPSRIRNARCDVSLKATVPVQTRLRLVSGDGSVRIAHITGTVDAKTSDGSIHLEDIKGDVKLKTSDGGIACTGVDAGTLDLHTSDGSIELAEAAAQSCTARTSDGGITATNMRATSLHLRTSDGSIQCRNLSAAQMDCHSSDGSILIECAADAPAAPEVTVTTSDGAITFAAPPGLSAVVEAATNNGSIHASLPITVTGKVGKTLQGTVGSGAGRVSLTTRDGSITIR
ncbi:MAG: DUF4097 family beta strand repeat protein [Phycisphaerae bacterium]|nr:DUF4097 family beta strand repeat protein [Phycisphaerae bacterium]